MGANRFILGTVQFGLPYGISNVGGQMPTQEAMETFAAARNAGIRFLDTAAAYGTSREVIGAFHQTNPPFEVINKFISSTPQELRMELDDSLRMMAIPHLYAWMYHKPGELHSHPESAEVLKESIAAGKVLHAGISVYSAEELESAIQTEWIDVIQLPFNLFDNWVRRGDAIQRAKKAGKEIHIRSAFLQGLFFMNPDELTGKVSALAPALSQLQTISQSAGLTLMEMALRYALRFPEIDSLVIGVDAAAQLKANLSAAEGELTQSQIEKIHQIHIPDPTMLNPGNWK
jgi:uncharacterized protein